MESGKRNRYFEYSPSEHIYYGVRLPLQQNLGLKVNPIVSHQLLTQNLQLSKAQHNPTLRIIYTLEEDGRYAIILATINA